MDCKETRSKIIEYLLGILEDNERRLLMEHIERCESCRIILRREKEIEEKLFNFPSYEPPRDLLPQIIGSLERKRSPLLEKFVPISIILTVFLVFTLILLKGRGAHLSKPQFFVQLVSPREEVLLAEDFKILLTFYPDVEYEYVLYLDGSILQEGEGKGNLLLLIPPHQREGYHTLYVQVRNKKTMQTLEMRKDFYLVEG